MKANEGEAVPLSVRDPAHQVMPRPMAGVRKQQEPADESSAGLFAFDSIHPTEELVVTPPLPGSTGSGCCRRVAGRRVRDRRDVGPRVGGVVDFLHPARRQVRVDLRRAQALVAQQLLHAAQVGAVVQQVRREAVTQRVRADARVEAGLRRGTCRACGGPSGCSATRRACSGTRGRVVGLLSRGCRSARISK